MRIPMLLSLIIFIIFAIFFNIVFINSNKIEQGIANTINTVRGRVLGVQEELATLPEAQSTTQEEEPYMAMPKKITEAEEFELLAVSSIAIDSKSETVLFDKSANKPWPVASITKLMTALVFLDHNPGWEIVYQIKSRDIRNGGRIYLTVGEKVKIKDLFYLSLVGSANTATMSLVYSTGLTTEKFINNMNQKAVELGLENTRFADPVGLSHLNISTAAEIAKFAKVALANEDISKASLTRKYEFNTVSGRKEVVNNTDDLLNNFPQNGIKILGGKTGYLRASGYCFVSKFVSDGNQEIITVVLGAESNKARFSQTKELVNWVYQNYTW